MVDPSTAELEGFATLADVFNWAGLSDPLRAALNSELGDLRLIRELASLPSKDIEDSIQDLDITVEGSTRKIKAVEKTRVRLARSACRLRCGLPNDVDTSSGTAVPAPVVGTVGPPAATVGGTPALAGGSTGIELGSVWDQTSRSTVRLLGTAEVSKLYERYKTVRGSLPHPDSECSEIQLSAMKQVNDIGLPPGADFAVFGPHGNRLLRRLNFTATFIDPEGNISKRELPGPPDYPMWWACYKPYRTGNIMHNYVDTEHLDNYAEHIKSLDTNWNGKYWFLVAMADYRMRSEHFERIRRRVELTHTELAAANPDIAKALSSFDPQRPWNEVFRLAVMETSFWDAEVKDKAQRLINSPSTLAAAVADGTQWPEIPGGRRRPLMPPPNPPAGADRRRKRPKLTNVQDTARTNACKDFNSAAGCQRPNCTEPHVCSFCAYSNHGFANCRAKDKKGKGRGKGGNKGKGGKR